MPLMRSQKTKATTTFDLTTTTPESEEEFSRSVVPSPFNFCNTERTPLMDCPLPSMQILERHGAMSSQLSKHVFANMSHGKREYK